jgi:alpha-L-fucosidase
VLWNDISYPHTGRVWELFAYYLNQVPDGVINNRFGVEFADFTTPEYSRYDRITDRKWEACRGLGYSFGYNRIEGPEHVIASDQLIELFVDIVSKNGNLLLNVGPAADGSISEIQRDRLRALGNWLRINGEGVFGSRPWVRPGQDNLRFTRKDDAVYAFLFQPPRGSVTIPNVLAEPQTRIRMLGLPDDLKWRQQGRDLVVAVPQEVPGPYAVALKITPVPWQVVRE